MNFESLFRDFWWLIFPIFGMCLAVWGMIQSDRRGRDMIGLIKSYTDQGKEPPPELLRLAAQTLDDGNAPNTSSRQNAGAWTFVVFSAMAVAFGTAWYMVQAENWSFVFLLVAVMMGIIALGALFILLFGRK